ncbi:MAG: PAS domain S-box protein [Pseudomonadota bacterium]|nr:PAS domain S-box protein [Pseudomonadota bacterium]
MNLSWGLLHAGLQTVLDTALDPVVVMDVDGMVIGWNRHSETCFGWSWDEARGQRLSDLIVPPAFRAGHEGGLTHYLATGDGPVLDRRIEVSALHRDGRHLPVELSVTASEQFGDKLFIGFIRDISDRKEEAERQQRILQESEHRVKNMLTVVQAIAIQTAANSADMASFATSFSGRLESLARAHQLLVGQVWQDVAVSTLAERVLGAEVQAGRARFGGSELLLKAGQVLGLSMILHELYTNAIKYGALCNDEGRIDVDWTIADETIELVWRELGSLCEGPGQRSSGFGQRMIAMSVKSDLNGTIERDWRSDGLTATLRFPAAG